MKYSLILMVISKAEPDGFSKGSVYISMYIPTQVLIDNKIFKKIYIQ